MPGKIAVDFLKRITPFSLLDERALARLVEGLSMQLYPAGAHILRQGEAANRALYIVKEGVVKLYARSPSGQEQVLDFRCAGETFGFLSQGGADKLDASVQAMSDAICYVLDGSSVQRLLEDHPELREYLLPAYFPKREGPPPRAAPAGDALHEGSARALFTTTVEELARGEVLSARTSTPAIEAARLMTAHHVGALVVLDGAGLPAGVVTNTDLRDKVLVGGVDPSTPLGAIMSAPAVCIQEREFCFEALLKMMSHGVHHLPTLNGERLTGIVSSHDFMVLQGTSPLLITREIEGQTTVEGVAAAADRVKGLMSLMLREGASAGSITRVISAVNDRLERRILDLALNTLGAPPVPFCWIVYGSAGRREQTFKTDQDNAIVYHDPASGEEAVAAAEYFGRFAAFVVDAFQRCGFARCQGNFMASNPEWRQPLRAWKRTFSEWIEHPADAAVFKSANLFDFRGVHGDLRLAAELKEHLLQALEGAEGFLRAMANLNLELRPQLGRFGSLVVEKSGEHANQLDIKKCCLTPLVNIVRFFSLERRIPESSTVERLAVLARVHPVVAEVSEDLAHAFELLSLLRIRHQHEQIAMDLEPDNFIQPGKLSSLEQQNLRQICRLLLRLREGILRRYAEHPSL